MKYSLQGVPILSISAVEMRAQNLNLENHVFVLDVKLQTDPPMISESDGKSPVKILKMIIGTCELKKYNHKHVLPSLEQERCPPELTGTRSAPKRDLRYFFPRMGIFLAIWTDIQNSTEFVTGSSVFVPSSRATKSMKCDQNPPVSMILGS